MSWNSVCLWETPVKAKALKLPMTHDQVTLSTAQATRLVDRQFPEFAGQQVRPLASSGADNWMFRLGFQHVLRFPRRPSAVGLLRREAEWLAHMTDLPLQIPDYVALGDPGEGYPWPWGVMTWIPGRRADLASLRSPTQAAKDLAAFTRALRAMPGQAGPIAGSANRNRGAPLDRLNEVATEAIGQLGDLFDTREMLMVWDAALGTPSWTGPPMWLHGDLNTGNLLARDGDLAAVIDFGLFARGDPAVDLMPGWLLFERTQREVFLRECGLDDDTLMRGMGWALYAGVVALARYRHSDRPLARMTHRAIAEVLGDM